MYILYICVYIYICNHENNVTSWLFPQWLVETHALGHMMDGLRTLCVQFMRSLRAQVLELPQCHCGDNQESTLFS